MKHKMNPTRHTLVFKTADTLHLKLETERLIIHSITREDEKNCIALFGDPLVMEKFATGEPYGEQKTKERLEAWVNRWKNHDPFSVYAIREKFSNEFMGIIALGHANRGESEPSYLIHHKFWNHGYGSEMADAVFQTLIPRLMLRDYQVDHKPLKKLVATARLDNPKSSAMLTGNGFKEEGKVYKYNAWRNNYSVFAKSLRNDYQNFFVKLDRKLSKLEHAQTKNQGVDFTDEEMAESAFGQQSITAKKMNKRY